MIGSTIGGALDPQVIQGPRIGEISQQTSQEGVPRPIVFDLSPPMAGNIIATSDPVIVKSTESAGKGGPKVETESVYRTYAIGVCEGPIGGFVRAWRNGILVYDVSENSIIEAADNAAFLEKARFFLGTYEQEPSADLEAVFGVGTTPAHQGYAYMVMSDEDLTDMRGAIPQWMFQVSSCGSGSVSVVAVASSALADPADRVASSADAVNYEAQTAAAAIGWESVAYAPELDRFCAVAISGTGNRIMTSDDGGKTWELQTDPSTGLRNWTRIIWIPGAGPNEGRFVVGTETTGLTADEDTIITSDDGGETWVRRTTTDLPGFDTYAFAYGGGILLAAGGLASGTTAGNVVKSVNGGASWSGPFDGAPGSQKVRACAYFTKAGRFFCIGEVGGVFSSPTGETWTREASDGTFPQDSDPGCLIESERLGLLIAFMDEGVLTSPDGVTWTQRDTLEYAWGVAVDSLGLLVGVRDTGSGLTGARIRVSDDGIDWEDAETSIDTRTWRSVAVAESQSIGGCTPTLSSIITTLCERVGIGSALIDTSLLTHEVKGFVVTNAYPLTGALQSLSRAFGFDVANYDGVLHFVPRGADSVLTIDEDDMLVDEIQQTKRADPISVPRVLHLNYHDVSGGLATDKQTSERSGDRRATGETSLQSPVVMDADEAAQVVSINHKVMIEDQKGEIRFSLPDSFIPLAVADVVIAEVDGVNHRLRIVQCDIQDGYQEITSVRDRQSAYTSDIEGIPAAEQTPPPSSIVGPTLIEPLDIHILRDADDSLSYYVAISGVLAAWQGAKIELSLDAGANYIDSQNWTVASIMGETTSALGDHPQEFPDDVNTVTVRIDTPLGELEETDLAGLLNRQNFAIIGNEIIQFANAEETSEGIWELSYFLRGRKGTATAEHASGSRFVLLNRAALAFVPANLVDIGRTLTFRATSFGRTTGTVVSMAYGGQSQKERAPAYVQAHMSGNNAVISWQGVGRLGSGAQVAHGAQFLGYRVTISDGSDSETYDTDNQTLTQDVSGFSSPLTISVQQRNNFTGLGPATQVTL